MRRASYGGASRGAPRGSSNMNRGESYSSRGGGVGVGGNSFNSLKNKQQPGGALRKPKWENETLQPFQKNFYTPHPLVLNRYVFNI